MGWAPENAPTAGARDVVAVGSVAFGTGNPGGRNLAGLSTRRGGIELTRRMLSAWALAAALIFTTLAPVAAAQVEIDFWHSMSGAAGQALNDLVTHFNASQSQVRVNAQFSGSYAESLTRAIAALRTGSAPNIIQVYEVGTQTMLDSGAIVPVYELAERGGIDFGDISRPIFDYYAVDGKLYSMPFNSSTAMLYYNKDIFRAAGLDPNTPPTTFDDVLEMGRQIVASGAAPNAISFGWPAWVFEQMHATHNQFYANNANGRSGRATEVLFNQPFGVEVVTHWRKWAEEGVFVYGGREYSANQAFISGQIAMLIQSTSSLASIQQASNFEVGTTFLPRLEGYPRGNSVIGGASLWVLRGQSEAELDAVWEFFKFINRTENAVAWHKGTGYFPVTNSAVKTLLDSRWFAENPNSITAFLQILTGTDEPATQGVLLGQFVEIRDIVDTALEDALNGRVSPQRALDDAAARVNQVLADYNMLYQ